MPAPGGASLGCPPGPGAAQQCETCGDAPRKTTTRRMFKTSESKSEARKLLETVSHLELYTLLYKRNLLTKRS